MATDYRLSYDQWSMYDTNPTRSWVDAQHRKQLAEEVNDVNRAFFYAVKEVNDLQVARDILKFEEDYPTGDIDRSHSQLDDLATALLDDYTAVRMARRKLEAQKPSLFHWRQASRDEPDVDDQEDKQVDDQEEDYADVSSEDLRHRMASHTKEMKAMMEAMKKRDV